MKTIWNAVMRALDAAADFLAHVREFKREARERMRGKR